MSDSKLCKRCNASKPYEMFRADPRYKDGYGSWCIECHRARNSEWAKENRARLNHKAACWRRENVEAASLSNIKHKRAHKDALYESHKRWVEANRDKRRAAYAGRKATKMRATVAWCDHDKVAAIYEEARNREVATRQRMHVDHIIPLQHELVCGLHCEANLQILPGPANEAKRNKFEPFSETYALKRPDLFVEAPAPLKQQALL